jgi:hypothetical protein
MRTFIVGGDDVPSLKLYWLNRTGRRFPFTISVKIFNAIRRFKKAYNILFCNLPKSFPVDFNFQRSIEVYDKQNKTLHSIAIGDNVLSEVSNHFVLKTAGSNKSVYVLTKENRNINTVTEKELRQIYGTIRKTGFLHFENADEEVSFDSHCKSTYELTAHGLQYIFIEATESPLHQIWEPNYLNLNEVLNTMKKTTAIELK